jgi:hypothetical protein
VSLNGAGACCRPVTGLWPWFSSTPALGEASCPGAELLEKIIGQTAAEYAGTAARGEARPRTAGGFQETPEQGACQNVV